MPAPKGQIMIVTYKYKPIFDSNNFEEFKKFVFDKYLQNRSYKIIMPEVSAKLEKFFKQEKSTHKKLYDFCYTLIGNVPWTKTEFWLKRGWSEEEAKQQISTKQSNNGKKFAEKQKQNPKLYSARISTQLQYWIKKGFTKQEAKQKLSQRQSTFSRNKIYKQYGKEKGEKIIQKRNQKWQNSLKENNDMTELNKSKAVSLDKMIDKYGYDNAIIKYNNWIETARQTCINNLQNSFVSQASKQSLNVFQQFYEKAIQIFGVKNIWLGVDDNKEFFIKVNNKLYFYDFTIQPLKLIFEYNGSHVHPNKQFLTENEWQNWQHVFTKQNANEVYQFDQEKIKVAKDNGFDVIVLWDSDTIEYNKQIVSESIKQKLNKLF
jgi:very-short-patch-repair endonuclease